jgi:cysteine desulfurase / selenocysteine lyase
MRTSTGRYTWWGGNNLGPGDAVVVTELEHHSNFVPWQYIANRQGAEFLMLEIDENGDPNLAQLDEVARDHNVKVVATNLVSNSLGTIHDLAPLVRWAHEQGAIFVCDAAQAAPHMPVDVQALDCDFYVFSGHKTLGPTGIGVLYGKTEWLERMPPYQGGGDMISSVTFEKTIYNKLPYKFEAGTPHVAGAIGLGAAIEYVNGLGIDNIAPYERELLAYATDAVSAISGVRLIGTAREKAGVLSFLLDSIHPHDIGTILDQDGIAIRTGHHCAQPVMQRFGIAATARASFALYNTRGEVDALVEGIQKVREVFA